MNFYRLKGDTLKKQHVGNKLKLSAHLLRLREKPFTDAN